MKLLFYLKRGTQDKNGKSPIMGRISIGRSMVQFSCKCACTPNLWDSRKQRLVGKSSEAVSVNNELDRLQVSVHQVYESLLGKLNNTVTAEHIIHESDMDWIRKPRVKTGNLCHIPLLPEASAIIERYRGIHTRAFRHEPPKGYLLPIPGCDTVNIHLKKIARLCGITKTLTFHMARHTFASQMTLSEGVSIESVSKMLGHSQIKTTQVYAETSPERVFRDVEKILPLIAQYRLTN